MMWTVVWHGSGMVCMSLLVMSFCHKNAIPFLLLIYTIAIHCLPFTCQTCRLLYITGMYCMCSPLTQHHCLASGRTKANRRFWNGPFLLVLNVGMCLLCVACGSEKTGSN